MCVFLPERLLIPLLQLFGLTLIRLNFLVDPNLNIRLALYATCLQSNFALIFGG